MTSGAESGPDSKAPGSGAGAGSASSVSRPSSPTPPGGPRAALRRRAAADHKESLRNARPSSTRSAGAGGSSGTMLKLYTDESPGLRVDPVVVLVLSLGFIFSVVGLHGCASSYCQDYSQVLFINGVCRADFGGGIGSLMAISSAEFAESITPEFITTYNTLFFRLPRPFDPPIPL
ncbi:translocon protein Sec61beta [Aspergillus sclerotialis]|uniref:Translocon protein Sec61beta n=1 Tax=Aspergillus sclerotialis TaxID=2070753 RepID=A0A3A2Z6H0_9EURO|nr:translocon protein Sec61beta [Aspergillus sclerotialis]